MPEGFARLDPARLVRRSTFWPAFLTLPRDRRADLTVLYAALAYADSLVDDLSPEEGGVRLEAFRKALASGYEHPSPPPGLETLLGCCRRRAIPWELWEEFFEGLVQDTTTTRYPTYAALEAYCYRVASVVGLMSIKVFGCDTPGARAYAVALGRALQLTNILRDIPRDASRGRLYLPLEDLERFGVAEEALLAGHLTEATTALLAFEGRRAREAFAEASRLKPAEVGRALLPAEIMRSLYEVLLAKIERAGYNVWQRRVR
ncbi:MAG: phytoene/squalene synthase family protein, partial [Candidatus Tectimicrobiota bacterium]